MLEFGKAFLEIYSAKLEVKLKHGSHATFIDLDISIDKAKLIYTMFDKRDAFNFHIVRIPSVTTNIPSIIFYSSTLSDFVRFARSALLLKVFLPLAINLLDRVINQGGSKHMLFKQLKNAFNTHVEAFQKYHTMASDIVGKVAATQINTRSVFDSRELNKLV